MTFADFLHKLFFPRVTYGVWIPGIGWLRAVDGQAYADTHYKIAASVAKRIGHGATAEYIDSALAEPSIEQKFLSVEKEGLNER